MKVKIYESKRTIFHKKQWRWRIIAANNRVIGASTEGFFNKADCESNIALVWMALEDRRRHLE